METSKCNTVTKEGDSSDVNNLRPVSLLPLPGKLIEKIVHSRIMKHLETFNLLSNNQGGFRSNHSTIDSVSNFTDDIYDSINKKEYTVAAFIDLKKAFDTVNHDILIKKLSRLGIRSKLLDWLTSYLSNRSQQTMANNMLSGVKTIPCGVPQGSILGPMLFLIYINDVDNLNINSKIKLYADDTVIYNSHSNIDQACMTLQADLDIFGNWCAINKLTINTKKSKGMMFGSRHKLRNVNPVPLKLNGINLHFVKSYKYLGINLDGCLSFNKQINEITKQVTHKLYMLSKIRCYLTTDAAIKIYKSMVLPYFDYGDVLLVSTNITSLNKLQKLQNRGLRICLRCNERQPVHLLHTTTNVPMLINRRKTHLRNFMFKRLSNSNYIDNRELITRYHDAPLFKIERPNCELYKQSIKYKGSIEWNNLDSNIRNIASYIAFKNYQKNWLTNTLNN